jgi:O-Antigen ligase
MRSLANSVNPASREPRFGAVLLLAIYGTALVAFPSDFGPRLLGFVLSPSRAILAALIVVLLVGGKLSLGSLRDMPRAVLAGWVLFLGSAAISTFVDPSAGAMTRYGSLIVEGFFLFWVVSVVAQSQSDVRKIALILVLATIAVAVVTMALGFFGGSYAGLFAGLFGTVPSGLPVDTRFGLLRQPGSFAAPLFFGLWLASASPLVLPYVERGVRGVRLASGVGWTILFSAVVLLTVSRMAITGMLAVAGAYFLLRRPRWLGAAALAVSLAVATGFASLSVGVPVVDVTPSPLASPAPGGSPGAAVAPTIGPTEEQTLAGSNRLRVEALQGALTAVSQRPLFGWGLLTEKEVVSQIGGKTNYVDSSYLALLVDLGLIGSSAFLFLLLAIAYACRGARTSAIGVSLGLATGAVLAMSGLAAFLLLTQGYALTWMLAALLMRVARPVASQPT